MDNLQIEEKKSNVEFTKVNQEKLVAIEISDVQLNSENLSVVDH